MIERWGTLAVVILAAGTSSRFGAPKQLAEVNGRPMLVSALAAAASAARADLCRHGRIRRRGAGTAWQSACRAPAAAWRSPACDPQPSWQTGQSSSLHASVRSLPAQVQAAIWMPVDQPYLDPLLLGQLAAAWRREPTLLPRRSTANCVAHRPCFDRSYWPELQGVSGDGGGRSVLRRHRAGVLAVRASELALRDIDSPSDLT